jgi:hypothetical protein
MFDLGFQPANAVPVLLPTRFGAPGIKVDKAVSDIDGERLLLWLQHLKPQIFVQLSSLTGLTLDGSSRRTAFDMVKLIFING